MDTINMSENYLFTEALKLSLGEETLSRVAKAYVLVVGAGGIGCEVLKTLALSGFLHIHVVDLDTVDATNLNRQFLFSKKHVGLSKAKVAREAVLNLCPGVDITAHHGNIKDPQFSPEFLQQFDVILNALDNNDARRYVNRLCISLDIPLIDSGSTGYNGQVTPIVKDVTTCFECNPLPRHKSFPICTIRSTPQKPEHCVAWAKYLFDLLFGPEDEGNVLSDLKEELLRGESLTKNQTRNEDFAFGFSRKVFEYVFENEVQKQASLKDVWMNKLRPLALTAVEYFDGENRVRRPPADSAQLSRPTRREPWSTDECVAKFVEAISEILLHRSANVGCITFDKDDQVAMDFVTAAANLRMHNYHIPLLSRWDAESIAGAIVPAIASTNAIVAGLQVIQAIRLLTLRPKVVNGSNSFSSKLLADGGVRHVWVKQYPIGPYILLAENLDPPKSNCYVCQSHKLTLRLHNLNEWTLASFVKIILNDELVCKEPVVELSSTQLCIYDPDMEEDDEDFAEKKRCSLTTWGVRHGGSVFVVDMTQETFECEIQILEDRSLEDIETSLPPEERALGLTDPDLPTVVPLTRIYRLDRCQTGNTEGGKRPRRESSVAETPGNASSSNGFSDIHCGTLTSRKRQFSTVEPSKEHFNVESNAVLQESVSSATPLTNSDIKETSSFERQSVVQKDRLNTWTDDEDDDNDVAVIEQPPQFLTGLPATLSMSRTGVAQSVGSGHVNLDSYTVVDVED